MSLLQDVSGFAESTVPLCAEGEIANPLTGLPSGAESHVKRPETYTVSYTYTLMCQKYYVLQMLMLDHI
jgi:hypothetical protein